MTVAELREFLADLPAEMQVMTYVYEGQVHIDDEPSVFLNHVGPLYPGDPNTAIIEVEVGGTPCVFIA